MFPPARREAYRRPPTRALGAAVVHRAAARLVEGMRATLRATMACRGRAGAIPRRLQRSAARAGGAPGARQISGGSSPV